MALQQTTKRMNELLEQIVSDLNRAERGNKAASQRVRTGTIQLEKIAKQYRKESVKAIREKAALKKKKPAGANKKAASKKPAVKKASVKAKAAAKKTRTPQRSRAR